MREDFVVIPSFKRFVPKEMDFIEVLRFDELQTIRFVPSLWKHIETDLATDRKGQVEIRKLLSHLFDHGLAHFVLQVKLFVIIAFGTGAVASDRRNVQHSTAELDERSSLHRYIQLGKVIQCPVHNALDVVFSQELGDGLQLQQLPIFVCH